MQNVAGWLASLMFIQAVTKLWGFALNFSILRLLTPDQVGLTALQLPFVSAMVTRIVKETTHRFVQRGYVDAGTQNKRKGDLLKLSWAAIPFTIVSSLTVVGLYASNSTSVRENTWMIGGLVSLLVVAWTEIAIEPILIYVESTMNKAVSVKVEVGALVVQLVSTLSLLLLLSPESRALVPLTLMPRCRSMPSWY